MRLEIKTKKPIKDKDIKALYILNEGMKSASSKKMQKANIEFILSKYGYKLAQP